MSKMLTPASLQPHYAQALISAIISSHQSTSPDSDLILYELGAGNGSFMADSLTYIRDTHPELFVRTKYRIIEISPELARLQVARAKELGVEGQVEVLREDFFDWNGDSEKGCFVIALEVLVSTSMIITMFPPFGSLAKAWFEG